MKLIHGRKALPAITAQWNRSRDERRGSAIGHDAPLRSTRIGYSERRNSIDRRTRASNPR